MKDKFKQVVEKYSEKKVFSGDDQVIQEVLSECEIEINELNSLSEYLKSEYNRNLLTNEKQLNETIESLQYGVNFIFEARENDYKVAYKSKYINKIV